MKRDEELAAIEAHIARHGVRRCKPGEALYGDDQPSFRERMSIAANRGKEVRRLARARAKRSRTP